MVLQCKCRLFFEPTKSQEKTGRCTKCETSYRKWLARTRRFGIAEERKISA